MNANLLESERNKLESERETMSDLEENVIAEVQAERAISSKALKKVKDDAKRQLANTLSDKEYLLAKVTSLKKIAKISCKMAATKQQMAASSQRTAVETRLDNAYIREKLEKARDKIDELTRQLIGHTVMREASERQVVELSREVSTGRNEVEVCINLTFELLYNIITPADYYRLLRY